MQRAKVAHYINFSGSPNVGSGEEMVTVEGIAQSFGDNVPSTGTIEIRGLGDEPRSAGTPFTAGSEDPAFAEQTLRIPNWPSDEALLLMMFQ